MCFIEVVSALVARRVLVERRAEVGVMVGGWQYVCGYEDPTHNRHTSGEVCQVKRVFAEERREK